MSKDLIEIARITSPSGIKGFVRVESFASNPEDLFTYNSLLLNSKSISLRKVSKLKSGLFVCELPNISTRDEAEALRDNTIMMERSALPQAGENQHYAVDLLDFVVVSKADESVGKVLNIINYGASDILEYENSAGEVVLIPFDAQFVSEVDVEKKRIVLEHYEVV
mgnify:CR=1 FL=1